MRNPSSKDRNGVTEESSSDLVKVIAKTAAWSNAQYMLVVARGQTFWYGIRLKNTTKDAHSADGPSPRNREILDVRKSIQHSSQMIGLDVMPSFDLVYGLSQTQLQHPPSSRWLLASIRGNLSPPFNPASLDFFSFNCFNSSNEDAFRSMFIKSSIFCLDLSSSFCKRVISFFFFREVPFRAPQKFLIDHISGQAPQTAALQWTVINHKRLPFNAAQLVFVSYI